MIWVATVLKTLVTAAAGAWLMRVWCYRTRDLSGERCEVFVPQYDQVRLYLTKRQLSLTFTSNDAVSIAKMLLHSAFESNPGKWLTPKQEDNPNAN